MNLAGITLQNFRTHKKISFQFSSGVTLIFGPNTTGKTNILEAIVVVSTGKSFRAKQNAEMIQWEKTFSRVTGECDETRLSCLITPSVKTYTVNGVAKRQVDFIGNVRSVLFWPEDLELVTDSPSIRRRYLDGVLSQIDREYRRNIQSYERGIRQRNKLLDLISEGKAARNQLLFWNQLLIKAGNYITEARQQFLTLINEKSIHGMSYRVTYEKSVISEARLEQYASEEVAAHTTLVGPHRDDFVVFEVRGERIMDLARYGSRGEQRLGVLWLKFAELSYIEFCTGDRPLLLLDDIFSELDPNHRVMVLDIMTKQQTIITSADPETIHELKSIAHEIIRL